MSCCRLALVFAAVGAVFAVFSVVPVDALASVRVDPVGGWSEGLGLPVADAHASVSGNGRFVAFDSAYALVWGDSNGATDVYMEDRGTGLIRRVSVASNGGEGSFSSDSPVVSADGRYVAFIAHGDFGSGATADVVYRRDMLTGVTVQVSVPLTGLEPTGGVLSLSMSGDGRFVGYCSSADNLVSGDTNGAPDAFLTDMQSGTTERVDVAPDGSQAAGIGCSPDPIAISADGNVVAFTAEATNLAPGVAPNVDHAYVRDRAAATTVEVDVKPDGTPGDAASAVGGMSADGNLVSFNSSADGLVPADTNGRADGFVRTLSTATTVQVDLAEDGSPLYGGGAGKIIGNGPLIDIGSGDAASTDDTNGAQDSYLHNLQTGANTRTTLGPGDTQINDHSWESALSNDGSTIVFTASVALFPNLVGNTHMYVRGPDYTAPTPPPTLHTTTPTLGVPNACGAFPVSLPWTVNEPTVTQTIDVQHQITETGAYTPTSPPSGFRALTVPARPTGTPNAARQTYRIRATDNANRTSIWTPWTSFRFTDGYAASTLIHYSTGWTNGPPEYCTTNPERHTTAANATATFTFTGSHIRWYARITPTRGRAEITVDGHLATTVTLYSPTPSSRVLIWHRNWTTTGTHTVRITNLATPGHPAIGIDRLVAFG